MINQEISQLFDEMADFLEMKEVDFRSRAYRRAARFLDSMEDDVGEEYRKGGLKALVDLPNIGQSLAKKIEEYIGSGKISAYRKLKKECPVDLESLKKVEGLGSRKIKILYDKFKIKNLKGLEKAAKAGKIRKLEGFGEKSEKNILEGIAFAKADKGRVSLGKALFLAREIVARLEKTAEVGQISLAGSLRRMQETIGDIDILITSSQPEKVMDFFVAMPEVAKVWAKGPTKSSVRLKIGLNCDLRVVEEKSFGSALQYFTGSKEHNIVLRKAAIKKRLKLNEYGLFSKKNKKEKQIAGRTEKAIYRAIDMPYIEPEIRTNDGEIEAALAGKLPKLIDYGDIKGDCHIHSDWSDGTAAIKQMAQAALKMGYKYLAITDHTMGLKIAGGLKEDQLLRQAEEIDKLNAKFDNFKLIKGCEANIKEDGSLDIGDKALAQLDLVIASIHSRMKLSPDGMTQRLIRVMENENVDVIGHPTGRLILRREAYALDFEKILETAKKTGTILEINAHPERLDLGDKHIRQAVEAGVKMIINADAHAPGDLVFMELGIAQARRGWAKKGDILNTKPLEEFLKGLKH